MIFLRLTIKRRQFPSHDSCHGHLIIVIVVSWLGLVWQIIVIERSNLVEFAADAQLIRNWYLLPASQFYA